MNKSILLYPIVLRGGTNMGPSWFPLIPIRGVAKVSCQGHVKTKTQC